MESIKKQRLITMQVTMQKVVKKEVLNLYIIKN